MQNEQSNPQEDNRQEDRPGAGQVTNNGAKPSGILPKNTQLWLMIGVSIVMVIVIALSGNPIAKEKSAAAIKQNVVDPNAARIAEYRNRIEEEAKKLEAEQAQLTQAKRTLGLPETATLSGGAMPPPPPSTAYASTYAQRPERVDKSQIEADKAKKEYQSRFASNVALSFRPNAPNESETPASASVPRTPAMAPINPFPYFVAPTPAGTQSAPSPAKVDASQVKPPFKDREGGEESPTDEQQKPTAPHKPVAPGLTQSTGNSYRLLEGSIIEAVLTNRLDGTFSGPVNAMVTTNVYSHDRQQLLVPQGSRVLGEVRRTDTFGQRRVAVVFHRVVMPDGYSASLDQFKGLNQIGATGLRDKVDNHYRQIFGVSLALGAIAGFSNFNTQYGANASALDAYRQGFSNTISQSTVRILDRYLNVLPTLEIREGHRIKIYISDDLPLPAYGQHKLRGDL